MFRKIILIFIVVFFARCSSKKVVSTVPYSKKTPVTVVKKPNKPVVIAPKKEDLPTKKVDVITETKKNDSQEKLAKTETISLDATSKVKVTSQVVMAYIEKYKETAKKSMQEYGIPASITLSQAILESGCGTGSLCLMANNHFGIKCRNDWKGLSVKYDDDAAQECFRKYNDPRESFKDHSTFLLSRSWYAHLFLLDKKDYKAWAKGLKASGYATDPKYPQKLIGIIEKYKLFEIDNELDQENKFVTIAQETITTQNTYEVLPNDTLYSVSKKFNISIDELKKINNLSENILSIGQILKIK